MGTRAWHLHVAVAVVAASGCGVDVDFAGTHFRCEATSDCPAGETCAGGYCGLPGAGDSSSGAPDAAAGDSPTPSADASPGSESLVFHAVADAYVDSTDPGSNHGSSSQLRVDGTPRVTSYIQFGGAELDNIDERYWIESARLEIFANGSHETGFQVSVVDAAAWSEGAITFADAPVPGDKIGSSGPISGTGWTSVVLAVVLEDGDFESFALTTDDDTALALASREEDEHAPRLVLVTAARW